jgi:hypothetical protein
MIKFNCKSCGQKFSVPESHAGKKGKCPKCNNIIVIPKQAEHARPDKSRITVTFACSIGNLIECPHCSCYVEVPLEIIPAEKTTAPVQPGKEDGVSEKALEAPQKPEVEKEAEETEPAGKRKLPWLVDIFLYPVSTGGLITLAVILILRLSTDCVAGFFMCCFFGGILGLIMRIIIVYSYMYWYFSECIRDSAVGGMRAPETFVSMPGLGDMILQWGRLFACYALYLGPVTFYRGYTYFYNMPMNNVLFWSLLAYGDFFFPMGILAVVMFDSVNGLNPILIIRSIGSTFLQYCGLAILFYGLGLLFLVTFLVGARWGILSYLFGNIVFIWLLLVAGHLLGRFYWRYQETLNWEV